MTKTDLCSILEISEEEVEKLRRTSWSSDGGEIIDFEKFLVEYDSYRDDVVKVYYPQSSDVPAEQQEIPKEEFVIRYNELLRLLKSYIPIEVEEWANCISINIEE